MIKTRKNNKLSLSLCITLALCGTASANVTNKDIANDQMTTDDVVSYGMGLQGQRYSPLTKINTSTVKEMRPAWAFSLGARNSVAKNHSQ